MVARIKIILISIFMLSVSGLQGQLVENPDFEKTIKELISNQVPIITVKQLQDDTAYHLFLDAREIEEFNVSHIPNARYVGYDNFGIDDVDDLDKDTPIVIYCSIGYRSDRIGGQLKKAGFTNVSNLFGSIFEWANVGLPMVDKNNKTTKRLHTYNKRWSQWVDNPKIEKTW